MTRRPTDIITAMLATLTFFGGRTLYNMMREPAPFDLDSPFWVLPLALELGQMLGVTDAGEISPLLRAR